jgi:hypothetical protein
MRPAILLSPEDEHLLGERQWKINAYGYAVFYSRGECVLLHRIILGAKDGEVVDHINGNPLDNRRENLRLCTPGQNGLNRRMHKNNAAGFPNVYWEPKYGNRGGNSFTAQVRIHGKKFRRRGFKTAEAAYEAAKEMMARLHGEFAKTAGVLSA